MGCSGCGQKYLIPPQMPQGMSAVAQIPANAIPGKRQFIGAAFKQSYIDAVLAEDERQRERAKAEEASKKEDAPK
jgi:hypothetical protein